MENHEHAIMSPKKAQMTVQVYCHLDCKYSFFITHVVIIFYQYTKCN